MLVSKASWWYIVMFAGNLRISVVIAFIHIFNSFTEKISPHFLDHIQSSAMDDTVAAVVILLRVKTLSDFEQLDYIATLENGMLAA